MALIVINHGKGIPDAIKTRLFDPFVTTKADGTGLGLALVASIIADHGGSVEVNDKDGETAFQINLPITRGWHDRWEYRHAHILLADDDPSLRLVLGEALSHAGYQVSTAETMSECLE